MIRAGYPKYKGTGLEWLEEIPQDWQLCKLGAAATVKARLGWKGLKADEYVEDGFVFLATPNIKGGEIDFENVNYITAERYYESPEIMLNEGDVLLAKDGSTLGITNVVRRLPVPATVNSSIAVIRPKAGLNSVFLYYLLLSHFTQSLMQSMKDGQGVPHLFQADIRKFWIWIPPVEDQLCIGSFLDAQTTKIDALITKKQRLIELLNEKRAAIISHAVTKGLDPKMPMKDSEIEWLGEIPEHWDVIAIKFVARVGNGSTPNRDNQGYWTDGIFPWLNSSVVNLDEVTEPTEYVTEQALRECHLPIIQPPAVLVGITGEGKTRGMATILRIESTINQHLAFLKPIDALLNDEYLRRIIDCAYTYLRRESDGEGSTKGAITCQQLSRMYVPLPPLAEQFHIILKINRELITLSQLVKKLDHSITVLREYRLALISAAVTGKIDVRDHYAQATDSDHYVMKEASN